MKDNKTYIIVLIVLFSLSVISSLYSILSKKSDSTKETTLKNTGLVKNVRMPGSKVIGVINIFSPISFTGDGGGVLNTRKDGALYWLDLLKKVENDDQVKVLLLRMNTPGGTIAATQEIYNEILKIKKQGKFVIVSMGDVTASGGYYIASAADYIVANPGTLTGSIGVIMAGIDLSDLFQRFGISYNVFKSGKYKDSMANYRKMTQEEKDLIQAVVMDAYWQFFGAVKEGRGIEEQDLRKIADGRILTAQQALKVKLVDELGDYQKAIEIAAEKAGLGNNYIVEDIVPDYKSVLNRYLGIFSDKILNTKSPEVNILGDQNLKWMQNSYVPVFYLSTY